MPLVPIGEALYYDGGIRSVAPVGEAINQGADEIVAIVCQASHLTPATFDPGDVLQIAGRLSDILTDGIVRSDLKQVERINRAIRTLGSDAERAFGRAYKEIKWKLIQPEQELPIRLDKFGPADIAKMIDYGRDLGRRVMQGGWSNVAF
jgi:predicted acylesterase/phospholipase RssA